MLLLANIHLRNEKFTTGDDLLTSVYPIYTGYTLSLSSTDFTHCRVHFRLHLFSALLYSCVTLFRPPFLSSYGTQHDVGYGETYPVICIAKAEDIRVQSTHLT